MQNFQEDWNSKVQNSMDLSVQDLKCLPFCQQLKEEPKEANAKTSVWYSIVYAANSKGKR